MRWLLRFFFFSPMTVRSWQPLKKYLFYATNADKDCIKGRSEVFWIVVLPCHLTCLAASSTGWPKDAQRFVANPPLGGAAGPSARRDIHRLTGWLGMRCLAKKEPDCGGICALCPSIAQMGQASFHISKFFVALKTFLMPVLRRWILKHCRLPKALKPSNMSETCLWAHFSATCRTKIKDVALMSTEPKIRRENAIQ